MGEWTQERHDKAIKRIAEKPYNDMGLICDNARDFLDVLPELTRLRAELEAVRGKATESDEDCAERVADHLDDWRGGREESGNWTKHGGAIVARHVAASVAPIQKRLDEAVGLLRGLKNWVEPRAVQYRSCEDDFMCVVCGKTRKVAAEDGGNHAADCPYALASLFLTPTTEQEEEV